MGGGRIGGWGRWGRGVGGDVGLQANQGTSFTAWTSLSLSLSLSLSPDHVAGMWGCCLAASAEKRRLVAAGRPAPGPRRLLTSESCARARVCLWSSPVGAHVWCVAFSARCLVATQVSCNLYTLYNLYVVSSTLWVAYILSQLSQFYPVLGYVWLSCGFPGFGVSGGFVLPCFLVR